MNSPTGCSGQVSLLQDERVLSSVELLACRLEPRARDIEHFQYHLFRQRPLKGPGTVDGEKQMTRRVRYPMQLLKELLRAQLRQVRKHRDGDNGIEVAPRIR